jgi:hypothetical protein
MNPSLSVPVDPGLSPDFGKARRLSRIMTVILAVGFWVTLIWLAAQPVLLIWPTAGGWGVLGRPGAIVAPASLPFGPRAGAVLAVVLGVAPSLLVLHHAGRVFANFARGLVFAVANIAHIRAIGLWLVVSGFASAVEQVLFNLATATTPVARDLDLKPLLIVFGVAVYVAAYVMAEAQRLADDNAAIV